MNDKFIKVTTNDPDGEIVIPLSKIVLERGRISSSIIYKLILGPKDGRSISQSTYDELKVRLIEKLDISKKLNVVEPVIQKPPVIPAVSVPVKTPFVAPKPKEVPVSIVRKSAVPFPTMLRKPILNTSGVPSKLRK